MFAHFVLNVKMRKMNCDAFAAISLRIFFKLLLHLGPAGGIIQPAKHLAP